MILPNFRNRKIGTYLFNSIMNFIIESIYNDHRSNLNLINRIKYRIFFNISKKNLYYLPFINIAKKSGFKLYISNTTLLGLPLTNNENNGFLACVKMKNNRLVLCNDKKTKLNRLKTDKMQGITYDKNFNFQNFNSMILDNY